ncbi:putative NUDIX family NTP pyrophosphohydrolase [Saccharopolyspora erythraea NRRL 2338]|uniref:NUDIX hydrolase n=2 Tax=Saccharopolyspora erythraea TaxID=1836 RepID=A4FGB1_SACEN|nr:NUDIX domain-containing protein [Saccharopolyspora erythraea]EQD84865.1 NTP pyrophosphohydrolase [Saccharopolyspora erythraea D]PFG96790.1 putative NUDIX family NTP pyrophosphohydrolase [Saccharopolyspora erythraea NRRL 2338]QRK87034.1 NUDIX domain-containing protein [Saccharopolyspora erythraea]CAM03086.1 NUDIX hydrolase [Saccharopolyspora erythraea NRRL 2338]
MGRRSAGVLLYRVRGEELEVLLVHPGGPFWKNKDEGAWSIPKGEYEEGDDPRAAAIREVQEETGLALSDEDLVELGTVRQKSGKVVIAWAAEGDFDVSRLTSNEFEMQWPPRSGRTQLFPEVDRAEWFAPETARRKLVPAQAEFLDRLSSHLTR